MGRGRRFFSGGIYSLSVCCIVLASGCSSVQESVELPTLLPTNEVALSIVEVAPTATALETASEEATIAVAQSVVSSAIPEPTDVQFTIAPSPTITDTPTRQPTACPKCNNQKKARTPEEWVIRWYLQ